MHYRIGQLHDGLKCFIWVRRRLRICFPQVGPSELKRQSNQWRHRVSPRIQKFRQEPSREQVMLIVAYNWEGVIPTYEGQTVNADKYYRFLQRHMRTNMWRFDWMVKRDSVYAKSLKINDLESEAYVWNIVSEK
ncbi:hypothetical protein TNCV_4742961 [Trichonephila clavipes]|nr:hypothetical protein TNCV_4742961 [Trichonephila clavipes]